MKTIYDLGLHRGQDTAFYLAKGFRVVALEANPALSAVARARFADAIAAGRLVVVGKALAQRPDEVATFFVRSDAKDDWSSLDAAMAERDGVTASRIDVETTTLARLFAAYGVPHYLKCDLEGADEIVVDQLAREAEKPRFVSVEASGNPIEVLARSGYRRFQLVNQGYLNLFAAPRPAREGTYIAWRFPDGASGLFGEELDPARWAGAAETARRLDTWRELNGGRGGWLRRRVLKKYGKLSRKTWLIGTGWVDIHARLDAAG